MSTDQLTDAVTNLTARLNQVDGAGLPVTSQSELAKLKADISGLKTTVEQVTLTLESQLNTVLAQIQSLATLLNSHLGVS